MRAPFPPNFAGEQERAGSKLAGQRLASGRRGESEPRAGAEEGGAPAAETELGCVGRCSPGQADGSGAVERAVGTGDEKKGGMGANGAGGFGSRDLKDWDRESCSGQAQKIELTSGRSAGPGSGVLSIAVVLKTLQELPSSSVWARRARVRPSKRERGNKFKEIFLFCYQFNSKLSLARCVPQ